MCCLAESTRIAFTLSASHINRQQLLEGNRVVNGFECAMCERGYRLGRERDGLWDDSPAGRPDVGKEDDSEALSPELAYVALLLVLGRYYYDVAAIVLAYNYDGVARVRMPLGSIPERSSQVTLLRCAHPCALEFFSEQSLVHLAFASVLYLVVLAYIRASSVSSVIDGVVKSEDEVVAVASIDYPSMCGLHSRVIGEHVSGCGTGRELRDEGRALCSNFIDVEELMIVECYGLICKYGDSDGYTFDDPILILEILSRRFLLRGIYLITGSSKDGDGDTSFQWSQFTTQCSHLMFPNPLAKKLGLSELQPHVDQPMVPIHRSSDQVVIGASALSLALDASSSRVYKIKENIADHRSALRDVFIYLAEPLCVTALTGMEGTSNVILATADTTTALSITFASVSTIAPISVYDYEVVGMDNQADADGNAEQFPNVDDAELNIPK
ncbi:hypothetical protein Tco_1328442 [Tanacetum coccineum]